MQIDWRYVGGIWDGEGCMGIFGDKRYPHSILPYASISQSNHYRGFKMIDQLCLFLRAAEILCYVDVYDNRGKVTGGGKRNYETARITIRGHRNVKVLLTHLIPHLIIRKNSAEDLLRFLLLFSPRTGKDAGALRGKRIGVREARYQAKLAKSQLTPL